MRVVSHNKKKIIINDHASPQKNFLKFFETKKRARISWPVW